MVTRGPPADRNPAAVVATTKELSLALESSIYALMEGDLGHESEDDVEKKLSSCRRVVDLRMDSFVLPPACRDNKNTRVKVMIYSFREVATGIMGDTAGRWCS